MKKSHRKIASLLVCAMLISLLTPPNTVHAANKISYALQDSRTALETNEYQMQVGEQIDFKFFGAPSNWKKLFKGWTSSNEAVATVDNTGVVTAKAQGTAYIKVNLGSEYSDTLKITVGNTVTLGNASQRAMSSLYLENISDTFDLNFYGVTSWNKIKKGASYNWTSSDTKVATVSDKGIVKAVAPGTAKISLKIKFLSGAVIETVPCLVTVDNTKRVTSQAELEEALKNEALTKVIIKTDKKTEISIPDGEYKNVKLVVDAPNADIINNGLFQAISIASIAEDTYVEMRIGNSLIILAPTAHIVIAEGASVDSIRVVDTNDNTSDNAWTAGGTGVTSNVGIPTATPTPTPAATEQGQETGSPAQATATPTPTPTAKPAPALNIEIKGSVANIVLDTKTAVKLDVAGTVENVAVNTASEIEIKGESSEAIAVVISDTADGTKLESSVKVDVDTSSETEINLSGGAEGSTVVASNEQKAVAVENNTTEEIAVVAKSGDAVKEEVKVTAGEKAKTETVTPTPTPTPTATNTPTPTATPTPTDTPVPTATNTPWPTATNTPWPTATNTPVPTATNTPVPTATNTATPTPTVTPIANGWQRITDTINGKEVVVEERHYLNSRLNQLSLFGYYDDGTIKTEKRTNYRLSYKDNTNQIHKVTDYGYDTAGIKISGNSAFYHDGQVYQTSVLSFNENGQVILEVYTSSNGKYAGKDETTYSTTYDETNNSTTYLTVSISYDSDDHIISKDEDEQCYSGDLQLYYITRSYEYAGDGSYSLEIVTYDADGNDHHTIKHYDADGNEIEYIDPDRTEKDTEVIDDVERTTEIRQYGNNLIQQRSVYGKDKHNNWVLTEEYYYADGVLAEKYIHTYDAGGDLTQTEITYYESDGKTVNNYVTDTYDSEKVTSKYYTADGLYTGKTEFRRSIENGVQFNFQTEYNADDKPTRDIKSKREDNKFVDVERTVYNYDANGVYKGKSTTVYSTAEDGSNIMVTTGYDASDNRTRLNKSVKTGNGWTAIERKAWTYSNGVLTRTDEDALNAAGKTAEKTRTEYAADGKTVTSVTKSSYEYDAVGNLAGVTTIKYAADGKTVTGKEVDSYDSNGNRTGSTTYGADGTTITEKVECAYSTLADGTAILTQINYSGETVTEINIWALNESGRRDHQIRMERYSNGKLNKAWDYTYDTAGNNTQITLKEYASDGVTVLETTVFDKDSNGNTIKQTEYDSNDVKTREWNYTYYDNGNWKTIKQENFYLNKVNYYCFEEYDENETLTSRTSRSFRDDGKKKSESVYILGPDGKMISDTTTYFHVDEKTVTGVDKTTYDSDEKITCIESFDANNNPTGKLVFEYSVSDGIEYEEMTTYDAQNKRTGFRKQQKTENGRWKTIEDKQYDGDRVTAESTYTYYESGVEKTRETIKRDENDKVTFHSIETYTENGKIESEVSYEYSNGVKTARNDFSFNSSGSVACQTVTHYDTDGTTITRVDKISDFYSNGDWLVIVHYASDGTTCTGRTERSFAMSDGVYRLVSETEYDGIDDTSKITDYWEYTYINGRNYTTKSQSFSNGSPVREQVNTYDADGNCTGYTTTEYSTDGGKTVKKFNANDVLIERTEYDAENDIIEKFEKTFDDAGNQTGTVTYGSDGKIKQQTVFTYDAEGNRTGSEQTSFNANGNKTVSKINTEDTLIESITYDDKDNIIREYKNTFDNAGNPNGFIETEYTASGKTVREYKKFNDIYKCVERIDYDANDKETVKYEWTYDDEGNEIKYISTNYTNGTVTSRSETTYDSNGNGIESVNTSFNANGKVVSKSKKFGTVWKDYERTEYDADGKETYKSESTYDADGNKTAQENTNFDTSGKVTGKTVYTFDADGNTTGFETTTWSENGKNVEKLLEYNGKLRLIERTVYDTDDNATNKSETSYNTEGLPTLNILTNYSASGRTVSKSLPYNIQVSVDGNGISWSSAEIEYTTYNVDNQITGKWENSYDGNMNRIQETCYLYTDGIKTGKTVTVYTYNAAGQTESTTVTQYDADDNPIPTT